MLPTQALGSDGLWHPLNETNYENRLKTKSLLGTVIVLNSQLQVIFHFLEFINLLNKLNINDSIHILIMAYQIFDFRDFNETLCPQ